MGSAKWRRVERWDECKEGSETECFSDEGITMNYGMFYRSSCLNKYYGNMKTILVSLFSCYLNIYSYDSIDENLTRTKYKLHGENFVDIKMKFVNTNEI